MDHPTVTDAADLDEYQKVIGASVEKLTTAYYEYMPKVSIPPTQMNGKYTEVITFHIRYGQRRRFSQRDCASVRRADADEITNAL